METFLCEKPDLTNETGDTTCGEGAAGESEEEDFVARVVIVGQKGVAFPDGVAEAFACCACKRSVMRL
jgi:hypothetical protein